MAQSQVSQEQLNTNIANVKKAEADNENTKLKNAKDEELGVQYTLFASGLNYGGRSVDLDSKNFSTDIAVVFDVVDDHTYTRTVDKTSYSTESNVTYSDHAVIEDGKFSFSAKINTSPTVILKNNFIDKDTDKDNPAQSKRPEVALTILEKIIDTRQLITLVTEDKVLENYIITSMTANRNSGEGAALTFDIELQEFRTFALGKTVMATVYSDPKKSGGSTKQKGAVQSSATDDDIEVTARRTKFTGRFKDGWQARADEIDTGNFTKKDEVVGTLSPNGTFKDLEGNVTDYNKIVGN